MKIKPDHLEHMRSEIAKVDTEDFRTAFRITSNSDRSYRWFCLRKANLLPYLCDTLYGYLNDDHVDTALKRVVTPL